MQYKVRPMNVHDANAIAQWHYPKPYSFYDLQADKDDYEEFLDFANWEPCSKFSVFNENGELVGFFEFFHRGKMVDVGLGLRPDLHTGEV
ncbi:hypothetical protein [Sulfobacillus thermosulfidooxidans]|uniref:hypothetical protein n=1 Tax=Sulfobacillus thermosulfidooxidans TaxID=28034 RepID=UPI00096B8F76|nr:hypothetical protein [Sulfobacillus thermosulfidooxidans]OLZ11213.1 hypothetical protein BFX05_08000 [Sulfobacillus thermosulfidooxidans]OLZ13448.1 hypothetical protein BFX06_09765 [Sulfobacillus thermosulfidooxidans]OLZ21695.1 hypothetical protein BFX07_12815 [Sulfobacillus thermosulfidooxidans]